MEALGENGIAAMARRKQAEAAVRNDVRLEVGNAMTRHALRLAMRSHTPDSYRQSVLKDSASPIAIMSGRAR